MFGRGRPRCGLCGHERDYIVRSACSPLVRDYCRICRPHVRKALSERREADRRNREEDERREEDWP